jgi:membrane protein
MDKTAIDYRGLKYVNIAIWIEVAYILIYGVTGLFTLLQIAAMSEISQGVLIFNTKIAPDIILVMFIANVILYIMGLNGLQKLNMGLNGLQKLNPFYRKACKVYIAYLIFMFLSIIAFVVFGFAASEFVVISFRSDSINTGTVSVLIWTFVIMFLAVQVVSNILNIIYMRNILLGTRRIADVLGNQELTKGITVTEKIYRMAMIVITVIVTIGVMGIVFVLKKYILKIIGGGAYSFVALYSALRGMQIFLFMLTAAYIISFIVRTVYAIRLTQSYVEITKHEISEAEEAALLEDMQAVRENKAR